MLAALAAAKVVGFHGVQKRLQNNEKSSAHR